MKSSGNPEFGTTASIGKKQQNGQWPRKTSMQDPRTLDLDEGGKLYHGTSKRFFRYHDEKYEDNGHGDGNGHDHGHAEKPQSILTAAASAIINFLLMFGLCCAYGMIMFTDDWNAQHRGLGVKLNLSTVMIMGGLLSWQSKVPVAMGGPDLNPVVFLGTFVGTMSEEIAKQLALDYPGADRRRLEVCTAYDCGAWYLANDLRFLGSSSSDSEEPFCSGSHLASHEAECIDYHEQLRATTIFAVSVSTLLLAVIFFLLGTSKKTQFVNYVPTNIMEAFLACVGFKVFKYALKFCKYDAKQFLPAAMIGVPLYFMKAKHIGNPAVVLPSMLLIPLGCFYIVLFASGSDLEKARENKLMFPKLEDVSFLTIWTDSVGKYDKINFKAWLSTMVDLVIMLIVCCMDNLLKLSSTEVKLPVKVDKDYEIQLHGKGNILTALCGSSVGYMQLKFNVINYGVMGNATDRRGGALTALLCGICFFTTVEHFNFLPRMFLSTLLFFAGSGFIAENLWGSRLYLNFDEWMQVLMVLAIFIAFGSLLYAVIAGALMIGVSFVVRYSKVPCTVGPPLRGGELLSCERRFPALQLTLKHIAHEWLLVVRLKGFVFFASATNLVNYLQKECFVAPDEDYRRLRFIIFDCEVLDAMDSSAAKAFKKFGKDAKALHVRVLWSSVDAKHEQFLRRTGSLEEKEICFGDLDEAVLYVEDRILDYRRELQEKWKAISFAFGIGQHVLCEHMQYEPFDEVLDSMDAQFGGRWDYCQAVSCKAFKTVLWQPGEDGRELFLVHSGAFALFDELPSRTSAHCNIMPVAVYRHGWFLNREALMRVPTRFHAVAIEDGQVLAWTRNQWLRMEREQPWMTSRIMEEAMAQAQADVERTAESLMVSSAAEEDGVIFAQNLSRHTAVPMAHSGSHQHDHHDGAWRRGSSGGTHSVGAWRRGSARCSQQLLASSVQAMVAPQQLGFLSLELEPPTGLFPPLEKASAAQFLERFGLFDALAPDEPGILPSLPQHIQDSLKQAFETYKVESENGDVLPWALATDALHMAGVFDVLLTNVERGPLTIVEFLELGHEAAMARLSPNQIQQVHSLYTELDTDKDGVLTMEEAIRLLAKLFTRKRITHEDVHSMAEPWSAQEKGTFDRDTFVMLVSRYVRKFGSSWLLLDAVREVFGLPRSWRDWKEAPTSVPGEKLFDPLVLEKINVTETELAEMLWASGCCGNSKPQEMASIDLQTLVQAARLYVGKVQSSLPPCPPRSLREVNEETKRAQAFFSNIRAATSESDAKQGAATSDSDAKQGSSLPVIDEDVGSSSPVIDKDGLISDSKDGGSPVRNSAPPVRVIIRKSGKNLKRQSGQARRLSSDEKADKRSFGSCFIPPATELDPLVRPPDTETSSNNSVVAGVSQSSLRPADNGTASPTKCASMPDLSLQVSASATPAQEIAVPTKSAPEVSASAKPAPEKQAQEVTNSMRKFVLDIRTLSRKAARVYSSDEPFGRCLKGHPLVPHQIPQLPQGKKVFACGRCSRKSNAALQVVYVCGACDFYVCQSCGRKQVDPPKNHMSDNLLLRGIGGVSMHSKKPRLTSHFPTPPQELAQESASIEVVQEEQIPSGVRASLYILLERPDQTSAGKWISNAMGAMIVLNLTVMIFKPLICHPKDACYKAKVWFYIEAFFCGLFTIEFIVRFSVCNALTNKTNEVLTFVKNPSNLCDLFSVVPFYFSLAADQEGAGSWALILKAVRLLRLARILRAMRLVKLMPKRYKSLVPPIMVILLVIWGIYNKEVDPG